MSYLALVEAVEYFAAGTQALSDADLERPWAWKSYDSEGVRFAFFRVYEELNSLAVRLEGERIKAELPPGAAQRILGLYHAAYCDLRAVLLGITTEQSLQEPAPDEWPVRRVYAHILGADLGFYGVVRHALDLHRLGAWQPGEIPDEEWDKMLNLDEAGYVALMNASLDEQRAYHRSFHARVLEEFAGITDDELQLPASYWEAETYPLHFRLGRFDSHMRQHTIQIDKTLAAPALSAMGAAPSEARRLLRLIYAALARVGAVCIGANGMGDKLIAEVAVQLKQWAEDIANLFLSPSAPLASE